MSATDPGFIAALAEAQQSFDAGGIPVGGAVVSPSGELLGRGHNRRVQEGSLILHGETAAFENAKHLPISAFKDSTIYTTLSPCPMCAGAMVFFGVRKVVIGENKNMAGREGYLRSHGIEVVVLGDERCERLLDDFIRNKPDIWNSGVAS
ncbi:cytidine and deoxycytidylate deaminase zinc-binding region [Trichoderma gamsii]|uniref:Cytosine deaminase n=1 Tax=Trichoderma gamsii TaxID=398673 RepID=A0A2P4Z6R7_9HYPO|nr:cytidine and deoxycytidylate deaminase zinc-binding region [Trichoderma gamsii]PON19976.1 cytidine and deoxycytidylate deaminase zinc-binding region [Trichoderma gamsii]